MWGWAKGFDRRSRVFFLCLSTAIATISPAWPDILPRSGVCAAYLTTSQGLRLARNAKSDAENILSRFRREVLEQENAQGEVPSIRLDSASATASQRVALGERIRGVELEILKEANDQLLQGDQPRDESQFSLGYVVRGKTAIQKHILDLHQVASEHLSFDLDRKRLTMDLSLQLISFTGMPILAHAGALVALFGQTHNPLDLLRAATAVVGAALLQVDFPYVYYRSREIGFFKRLFQLNAWMDSAAPGSWTYETLDTLLQPRFVTEQKAGALTQTGLNQQQNYSRATFASRLFKRYFNQEYTHPVWFLTDRLFYIGQDGEPVLVVFIRSARTKPKYPKAKKVSALDQIKEGLKVPIPAWVPGKR